MGLRVGQVVLLEESMERDCRLPGLLLGPGIPAQGDLGPQLHRPLTGFFETDLGGGPVFLVPVLPILFPPQIVGPLARTGCADLDVEPRATRVHVLDPDLPSGQVRRSGTMVSRFTII